MQDIEAVDPEYYKNLRWMLEHDISDVLDLTFTEEVDYFGRKELVELKPGGAMLKVRVPHFIGGLKVQRGHNEQPAWLQEDQQHVRKAVVDFVTSNPVVTCAQATYATAFLHCGTAAWIWCWDPHAVAGMLQRGMAGPAPAQCDSQNLQASVFRVAQVTEENKKEYVNLVAQHRMTTAIREQLQAFLSGFWDLVPKVRPLRPCA